MDHSLATHRFTTSRLTTNRSPAQTLLIFFPELRIEGNAWMDLSIRHEFVSIMEANLPKIICGQSAHQGPP